ncbi:MAG: hypothetical protein RIS75_1119 [Actinomycetota bacterium]
MTREPEWGHRYVEEVCEEIWRLEDKFKLLDLNVIGVNVWPLIRMPVYYRTATACGFFDEPHPGVVVEEAEALTHVNDEFWEKFVSVREFSVGKLMRSWFSRRYFGRDVVVTHGRKQNGVDIYTEQVIKEAGALAAVFDRTPSEDSVYPDLLSFRWRFNRIFSQPKIETFDNSVLQPIYDAISEIETKFHVDLSKLRASIPNRIILNARQQQHYVRLFKALSTKRLFITNSYFSTSLIAAAKSCNVRVIELQHGFISKFHMGYSYPGKKASPVLPDEMWCFGQFWVDDTHLHRHLKTRIIGAPYVHHLAELEAAPRTDSHRIVVTSQGAIGQHLLPIAVEIARNFHASEVVFRLHPSEKLEDMQDLLTRTQKSVPANFSLNATTPNIFALMKSADVIVGVFSTTLLEGMALGARTMIVALPGYEYMDAIVGRGDVSIAMRPDEVVDAIRNAPHCTDANYYYAHPVTLL